MDAILTINPENGQITLPDCLIHLAIKESSLPTRFLRTHQIVQILGRAVECTFATASQNIENVTTEITLRFEEGVLDSMFLSLTPPEFENLNDDDFYNSSDSRYEFHSRWLQRQFGKKIPRHNDFSWRAIGVGRDKSENVFIYFYAKGILERGRVG